MCGINLKKKIQGLYYTTWQLVFFTPRLREFNFGKERVPKANEFFELSSFSRNGD